ncbi:U-box domain-containing protein 4 [Hordeum vulgare]|nr:U-box domain-containing protein 4 [Hordeum vulgare]
MGKSPGKWLKSVLFGKKTSKKNKQPSRPKLRSVVATLYRLCSARRNKERAVSAGAVVPVVHLIGERGTGTSEKAMVVLASLASIADGRDAVVEAGGIPALVETIEDGPVREKDAVVALLQLCSECSSNRALLIQEGATGCLRSFSLNFASDSSSSTVTDMISNVI